jgi:hypothetical protein
MLDQDGLWWMEELPVEYPSEWLGTMPEIRQRLERDRADEYGLRSILERPEVLSRAWRRQTMTRRRGHEAKRHGSTVSRAA